MAPTTALLTILVVGVVAQNDLTSNVTKWADLRIVRGQNAQLGQFPWQAWIECIRFNFLATGCGGSLITTSHILTAAHCVDSVVLCQVSLGLISLKERGYSYFLHPNNMIIHGNYQADSYSNDIAIIRLRSSVKLTENIQPIRLAKEFQNSRTLSGMPAIVSGWGKTRDSEKGRHQLLQYGTVRIMPEAKCIPFFKRMFNLSITSGHICTDFSASNVCNGDSGGPLAIIEPDNIWTLIGIISLGVTPCEEGIPSVFTAVANYLPWIYNNTQK
ncbi:fibrinolytic enzyme, isozyme C [Halyomorpha halys]|uniref:fibrinolytic enzyme, isozyme C n=1 Tax=Halyomorpha halys TaxID=286706 RepID=UPI0006D4E47C|nr:fibrinolytic enzyme, isozyme C [Halyomorpha halys]